MTQVFNFKKPQFRRFYDLFLEGKFKMNWIKSAAVQVYFSGVYMESTWFKPEFAEVSVNAECTAYSDTMVDDLL